MLKEERFQKLLGLLEADEFMTVQELSRQLNVSMPTVRRDLADLAAQNRIIRSHGGAMRMNEKSSAIPVDFRRSVNAKEKAAIAKMAAEFIHNESVIFLDASTTAAYLFDYLQEFRNLIVVTNSLMAAIQLKNLGIRTYCLGGEVISNSSAVGGRVAMESAGNFNVDVMFFSSYGINDQGMIVDSSEAENELRRYVMERAGTSVFLCDKSKFGKNAVFNLVSLTQVDYMVTNGDVPGNYPSVRKGIRYAKTLNL